MRMLVCGCVSGEHAVCRRKSAGIPEQLMLP